jgi:hypothetical protein
LVTAMATSGLPETSYFTFQITAPLAVLKIQIVHNDRLGR